MGGQTTNSSKKPFADAPPEADSSSDDDIATTSEEEDLEEESSDGEEEDTPVTPPSSFAKKLPSAATNTSNKRPAPAVDDDVDDSSTDDDESPLVPKSKPVSKPNADSKPRFKPTVSALPAEKRPSGSDVKGTSSKKPRKEKSASESVSMYVSGSGSGVQEEGKKLFQRVFSEDDEIEILKGMIEYRAKRGSDPMVDVDDFYAYVKKSLHVDVNKGQIVDKVRRLKKKYFNAKKKKLSNPHEIQAFELSKKIWDSNNVSNDDVVEEEKKVSNGGVEVCVNNHNHNHNHDVDSGLVVKPTLTPKARVLRTPVKSKSAISEEVKKSIVKEGQESGKEVESGEREGGNGFGEEVAWEKLRKEGFRLMGAKARAEIEDMWGKVAMKQAEAKMLRSEVEQEEIRRILEALRKAED